MAQPNFPAAPGRRPLPRFLANIGIVVPALPDDHGNEEHGNDEETCSDASSVATIDSSVVSETDSEASAGESDFSAEWIQAIEAATDVTEEHWRSLLLLLRTQRNHFPPTIPPPPPPSRARDSRRQPPNRSHQEHSIRMQNAFQALALSDSDSEGQDTDRDVPVSRQPSSSTLIQCRYLKVMVKVNISDVRRRDAQGLLQQKLWLQAADLFAAAHSQLHLVMVRHDDWWALASQYTDAPDVAIATSHDVAFLSEKLWPACTDIALPALERDKDVSLRKMRSRLESVIDELNPHYESRNEVRDAIIAEKGKDAWFDNPNPKHDHAALRKKLEEEEYELSKAIEKLENLASLSSDPRHEEEVARAFFNEQSALLRGISEVGVLGRVFNDWQNGRDGPRLVFFRVLYQLSDRGSLRVCRVIQNTTLQWAAQGAVFPLVASIPRAAGNSEGGRVEGSVGASDAGNSFDGGRGGRGRGGRGGGVSERGGRGGGARGRSDGRGSGDARSESVDSARSHSSQFDSATTAGSGRGSSFTYSRGGGHDGSTYTYSRGGGHDGSTYTYSRGGGHQGRSGQVEIQPSRQPPPLPTILLVDSISTCRHAVSDIHKHGLISVDLEGVELCRSGEICILQVALPNHRVFLFDICALRADAFEAGGLRDILSGPRPLKLMFDCRADADALFHQYRVRLDGVYDLQVAVVKTKMNLCQKLPGLAVCINKCCGDSSPEAESFKLGKNKGADQFAPERGGSYEVWRQRPLSTDLLNYCAQDVSMLFACFEKLRRHSNGSEAAVVDIARQRIERTITDSKPSRGGQKVERDFV